MGRELANIYLGGEWLPSREVGAFRSYDPRTGDTLPPRFPISSFQDLEAALTSGSAAARALAAEGPAPLVRFLRGYAGALEDRAGELAATAERETALPSRPRLLEAELPRTVDQLRQAALAAEERSWTLPTIDRQTNIRSLHVPLGKPVVVFGPSNFPLAFNAVSGGDFAAALAAGNPVIAKGHPLHPTTTRLLTELAAEEAARAGLPAGTLQMVYDVTPQDGLRLVADRRVGAVAFTGSRRSGLAIKAAADLGGVPAYVEMGSLNPVLVLPGALAADVEALAEELSASALLAVGQLCTKPGLLILLESAAAEELVEHVAAAFEREVPGCLLSELGLNELEAAVGELVAAGAEVVTGGLRAAGLGLRFANTLLRVTGEAFLARPAELQREVFGNALLAVLAEDEARLSTVVEALLGSLTGTIYSTATAADDELYGRLAPRLAERVGRLLNDKPPTGVVVVPSMVHGGPFPATGHPGFTAVGIPASLRRFSRLLCYDNVRQTRLPEELRDSCAVPGLSRLVNGRWLRTPG